MHDLMKRETIDELCARRDKIVAAWAGVYDVAEDAFALARGLGGVAVPERYRNQPCIDLGRSRDEWVKEFRKNADRALWTHLMSIGQFESLMDHQARQKFREQLLENPPEATPENCYATFEQLLMDSRTIFLRGVANAFAHLDRRFRSHDGFKIKHRMIYTYFHNCGSINWGKTEEYIRDVERVFRRIDPRKSEDPEDKKQFNRGDSIVSKANMAMSWSVRHCQVEDDYFRLVCYKNGNAHMWFKRADLLEEVNKLLAEYYGETVGDQRTRHTHRNRDGLAKNFGFFPTPEAAGKILCDAAGLGNPGKVLRILEPSAGNGKLAWAIRNASPAALQPEIIGCEIQPELCAGPLASGLVNRLYQRDFLTLSPEETGLFDRIVMNPPFDDGRDIDHVRHALRFLKPGGLLVSIMIASTEYREDNRTEAFREYVAGLWTDKYERQWLDLPAGSFRESGTNVNTIILKCRAPL